MINTTLDNGRSLLDNSLLLLAYSLHFRSKDAKSQSYYQPIEMKFCFSHFNHKGMPDVIFESGSFSTR